MKGNLVGHIKERLQRANLTVFVDYGMRKGVESWAHVSATLRGARGVLVLLTEDFEESPWCLEEARSVAARLDEARAAGAQQGAVLPVFIDRETRWDEEKLAAAFSTFSTDRDFDQLRTEEPGVAADIVELWRKALNPVACTSYMSHSFEPARRSELCSIAVVCCELRPWRVWACDTSVFACSFDVNIVDAVHEHFLEVLCPLFYPAVECEVDVPGVVEDMRLQLLDCKVSVSPRVQNMCSRTHF